MRVVIVAEKDSTSFPFASSRSCHYYNRTNELSFNNIRDEEKTTKKKKKQKQKQKQKKLG